MAVQIAYAVDDVEEAAREHSATFGSGPFFVAHDIPLTAAWHDGQQCVFRHSSAYGQWGAVMVELVHVIEANPPTLAEAVVKHGGLHHVAWMVEDFEAAAARLEADGARQVLRAETAVGVTFAFHDARATLGHLVELYESGPVLQAFYERVAEAARCWDGTDPVRRR